LAKSIWNNLEEVKSDNTIGLNTNPIENTQPKQYKSVWDNLEEVNSAENSTSSNSFDPNFGTTPQSFSEEHPLLYGGIKKMQQSANDFGSALNNPIQNPNIAQGLGNIARDLGQFGTGLVHGVPQFISDIANQATKTGSSLKNDSSNWQSIIPTVGHGIDKAIGDIFSGTLNLPEAIAASYKGRQYNPHFQSFAPVEHYIDLLTNALYDNKIISQEQYANYLKHKAETQQAQAQLPLAQTIGEFLPAMLPIGKVAGLGKAASVTNDLSKAQKFAQTAKEIGKAAGVGAGYGFVVNPEGSLAERSATAGSGTAAGALLGAGGKVVKAGIKSSAPFMHENLRNAAYTTGKGARKVIDFAGEVKDRLNPNNYETILETKPVERGTGLSRRTVYESKPRTVFKGSDKTKSSNHTMDNVPEISIHNPGTDFVMGEGSELKTPKRPKYNKETIEKIRKIAPKTAEKIETEQDIAPLNEQDFKNNMLVEQTEQSSNIADNNKFTPKDYVDKFDPSTSKGEVSSSQMSELKKHRASVKKSIDNFKVEIKPIDVTRHSYKHSFHTNIAETPISYDLKQSDRNYNSVIQEIKNLATVESETISDEKIAELENKMQKACVEIEGNEADIENKWSNFWKAIGKLEEYQNCNTIIDNTKINKKLDTVKTNEYNNNKELDNVNRSSEQTQGNIETESRKLSRDNRTHSEQTQPNKNDRWNDENNAPDSRTSTSKIKSVQDRNVRLEEPTTNESEVTNGYSTEETNGIRPRISEGKEPTKTTTNEISQGKSSNERPSNGIRRENNISNDGQRGISLKDKEVIEKEYKNQHELNKAIEDYINNGKHEEYTEIPQEIKDWLKKYAGAGGLEKQGAEGKGLLSEYYTPQNIVNKMWDLTAQYVNTNGAKVLEPSVGIGRFLENAPKNTSFDVVEMNPVSAKITKILYPDANVTTGEFQERFIDKTNNKPVKSVNPEYDIVIGNPPYGQYSGRYKGMGEGKKYSRLEAYFINRGLDSLKENGIMTYIVPSSFLEGAITPAKSEIGSKCELIDAYRLPENMFDTTSLGTDIIVLRKTALKASDKNLSLGKWFKANPDKILGTVEQRKNKFGKLENIVKGDKNAVDNIDTSKKDIKETVVAKSTTTEKTAAKKSNHIVNTNKKVKKPVVTAKGKVEYTEYQHENTISDIDLELFQDTQVDGTLPESKYKPNEKVNEYKGKLYNDFNYLQGDIYEKLEDLENSEISEKQKEIQKKKLLSVLSEPKTVENIAFNPTSDFIREQSLGNLEEEVYDYSIRDYKKVNTPDTLDRRYKKYIDHLTNSERNGVSTWDMKKFIDGDKIRIDYHYSSYSLTDAEKKAERNRQYAEYMTKLKNTVDKTFNDFVKNELTKEEKQKLEDAWNRKFNATYNPDFKKMPMIVKGLNSEFYGKKLKLQNVQVEGVNFLTNKGVGLLGFEVGVGKTLTGIISTVQNMQMGRCKKPLVLVPKQVKDNWIKEFKETFPNLEINDVDNMSKFKGEIKENTVTVATYEALGNIWYGENSANDLIDQIYSVSNDFNRESTKRGKEKTKERAEELVGKAEGGNKKLFNIQEIGFDHLTIDEAHNFKNLFADAKADGQEGNTYVNISGGSTSTRAARLFLLTQYVLNNNGNRNVFMLTATPFNNSPLEVFNMLSYLAKDELDKKGLYNVYQFMENYADINSDWIVNSRNEVEYKQVVTGFKNASSLRELIKSVMLIRSAEDAGIVRPEKYTKRVTLEPSQEQIDLIAKAEEEAVTGKKDEGAVLKAINQSRKATLSPDIATDNFDVSPEDFIKNSPKLNYIMSAVESMKKKDSKTSQLIYMPLGVKFLPKIKQYLVNKGVFTADEVAIIDSSVSDDKITKITDSFNDREGKVKLVIGTNKIKEGMNLNKNSSVLYVPYMDWNPTDFVQVVGRIWRRGNRYSKIRVVVPLLKNSSDSFMFQKLNEKTDRINNIMDESKEYIDTSELNTSEEKINMISNPEKKMKMFVQVEKQKLNAKVQDLQGRLETSQAYLGKLKSDEKMLKYSEEQYAENSEKIKNIDSEKDKWDYEYTQKRINEYKKDIASYKLSLKKVKEKIARLELDFEGKDSEEVINAEIEKVNQDIQDVEEYGKKKLVEFTEEYENERKNKKSISELIKEFEKDTEDLYPESSDRTSEASVDIPDFMNKSNNIDTDIKDVKLEPVYNEIKKGIKGKDLAKYLPKEIGEVINDEAQNYIFGELKTKDSKAKGVHRGKKATIELNLDAIGNNPYLFIKTLMHEIRHANQLKTYLQIMGKPKNTWTANERTFVAHYNICKKVNKERKLFYNKHKELIDKYDRNNFYSAEERAKAIFELKDSERNILIKYNRYYDDYKNALFETEARAKGAEYAKGYRQESRHALSRMPETQSGNIGRYENGDLLSDNRFSTTEESSRIQTDRRRLGELEGRNKTDEKTLDNDSEYSIGLSKFKQKENVKSSSNENNRIKEKAEDKIYKWYGNIGKDRFDVDKNLNSFITISKAIAKEYTKKLGIKVTDKMVREVLPFLRERTDLPKKLNRPELTKFFDKLSGNEKARLTKLADDVSAKFDKYYKNYQSVKGVEDAEGIENHISHIWDLDKKHKALLTNYFSTSSKFAKERTINTLVKGIDGFEVGNELIQFKPKTLDYAEILKTSSDNLIKATHDITLANEIKDLKYKNMPLVMATSKAPADWVEIDHPALNKAVYAGTTKDDNLIFRKGTVKVHPAIAKKLEAIFEIQKPDNAAWKLYDNLNGILKQSTLGFSGFHGYALSESAVSNFGIKNTLKSMDFKKIYNSVAKGDYEIFKKENVVKQAIKDGLQIGTPLDLNRNQVEEFIGKIPVVGHFLKSVVNANNKILWDCLHTIYKINAYDYMVQEFGGYDKATKQQRRAIAQWVNDSFGGQAWELLGIKKSSIKAASRILLSPDWNFSTIRQTMGLFDSKKGNRYLSEKDNPFWKQVKNISEFLGASEEPNTEGVRGKNARAFFLRFIIYSAIGYNLINATFREKDREKHPELYPKKMNPIDYSIWGNTLPSDKLFDKVFPYVFIGRNSDGSARYLRVGKQVREVPEMISDPVNKFGGKSSSLINVICQTALGISPADVPKKLLGKDEDVYYNQNLWQGMGKYAKRKEGAELYKGMGKTLVNSALPFVVSKALDEKHEPSAWDMFAQTSKGVTYGKAIRLYKKAYKEGHEKDINKISRRAYQDGLPKDRIEKAQKIALRNYRADNTSKYKHRYIEAMNNNDKKEIQKITNQMSKNHLPVEEQKRIYYKALKDYYKEKGI
jgi:hypothetical protein